MKRKPTIIEGETDDVTVSHTYFETQIDKFNFRFRGTNIIEVSYISDRNKTPIYEIVVKDLTAEKDFHKECSYWFMREGINF